MINFDISNEDFHMINELLPNLNKNQLFNYIKFNSKNNKCDWFFEISWIFMTELTIII